MFIQISGALTHQLCARALPLVSYEYDQVHVMCLSLAFCALSQNLTEGTNGRAYVTDVTNTCSQTSKVKSGTLTFKIPAAILPTVRSPAEFYSKLKW